MAPLFDNFADWGVYCKEKKVPLYLPVLDYERSQRTVTEEEVFKKLRKNYLVMREAIEVGLTETMESRSGMVRGGGKKVANSPITVLSKDFQNLVARAIAAKEVNACMGRVVAAPTAGASGILPAVLHTMELKYEVAERKMSEAMLVAAGVGLVVEHRASVSGAIGGCQAETGTAGKMPEAPAVGAATTRPIQALTSFAAIARATKFWKSLESTVMGELATFLPPPRTIPERDSMVSVSPTSMASRITR